MDREVEVVTEMIKGEMNRLGDGFTKQMTIMLTPPPVEHILPQAITESLSRFDKGGGFQGALQGMLDNVLPQQLQVLKEKSPKALIEEALAEYQAALDAEIQHVQYQMERIKRDALQPFMPSSSSSSSPPATSAPSSMAIEQKKAAGKEDDNEDAEDEDTEEEELLKASVCNEQAKKLDIDSFQASLQQLLEEKASIAQSVKEQAEKKVYEVISQSSQHVEKVR